VTLSPAPDAPDADLVARAKKGEEDAFAELVRRHERRVYNLAYRMLGRAEDARDASQEAFVSCYRNLRRYRAEAAFGTWLHRIALNACYDVLRKRAREPVDLNEGVGESASGDPAEQASAAVDVQHALTRIPEEFRAVVIMHDVQGFPYEDIAAMLEVPIGTVKSRLHRGRVALATELRTGRTRIRREPAGGPDTSKRAAIAKKSSRRTSS
jgi:RNA polymerase sigma-70 factor (ECF subfamily)